MLKTGIYYVVCLYIPVNGACLPSSGCSEEEPGDQDGGEGEEGQLEVDPEPCEPGALVNLLQ